MRYKSYFITMAALSSALAIAISLWLASPAILSYAQGGYGGGGGGGGAGGAQLYPGLTLLGTSISSDGVLTEDITAIAFEGIGQLVLKEGTRVRNRLGGPLYGIVMVLMGEPPAPPASFNFIGRALDLGPDGATFEPSATLTLTYDPALLPEGFNEENLAIAMWDEATGEWVVRDSTVDTNNHTVSTQISHFTPFTILAGITPATFTVTDLTVAPSEVGIGEEVTISALVSNTGYLSESYEVTLKINDEVIATEEVTLPGLATQKVTFTIAKDVAGTYAVNVNGLAGTFDIVEAPPAPAPPAPTPPAPTPSAPPPTTPLINWYLVGAIIPACLIIGAIIWLAVRRQRAQED